MEWLDKVEAQWRDAVARWQAVVTEFEQAYNLHLSNKPKAEALGAAEYQRWLDQLDYANHARTAIEMLQSGLASTSSWARDTFGLAGLKNIGRTMSLNGMGAIPLIPVAVIVGSISTVTSVIYALYSYNAELMRKWDYIQSRPDITPAEVEQVLTASAPIPVLGSVGSMALWIVVGGLILFFGPQLLAVKRMKQ